MKKHIPAIVVSFVFAVIAAVADYALIRSQFLPLKLTLLATALLVLLVGVFLFLLWNTKKTARFVVGCVLAAIFAACLLFASSALFSVVRTLDNITGVKQEYTHVVVYVAKDDPAESVQDAVGYKFGILESLDRENTDHAISNWRSELNCDLVLVPYSSLSTLAEGFLKGECNAIIINTALMDLYSDLGKYTSFPASMRELTAVKIEQKPTEPPVTEPATEATTEPEERLQPFLVYISGIDSYGDISSRSRSDVNILAAVNPNTRQILLISTPRDYFVKLPNVSGGERDKLTHAGIYGINCSMDTLSALYDAPVDYYFRVNFTGFEAIIDALGGITVHSDYEFWSLHWDYYFEVGDNEVNGQQALDFARERDDFPTGDLQRGKNQMEVIRAVAKKALSPAILTGYSDILASLEGSFETSIPYEVIAKLARDQLTDGGSWEILSYGVTGEGDALKPYSLDEPVYVMLPDWDIVAYASDLIHQVLDGKRVTVDRPF